MTGHLAFMCPVLIENTCLNCNEKGHTPKNCGKLQTKKKYTKTVDEDGWTTTKTTNKKELSEKHETLEVKFSWQVLDKMDEFPLLPGQIQQEMTEAKWDWQDHKKTDEQSLKELEEKMFNKKMTREDKTSAWGDEE
jgi:hypothetical protein